ncbi:hypothetical protein [Streptomyces sp. NPDC046197]|uniref:hypothetical protein n=1 Tax=Streptomyces sp. NPDC046197 TaxID=3154337 RepID=UPI0033F707D7
MPAPATPQRRPAQFASGLDNWSSRPGWNCIIGYDGDQAVGYTYGAPLPQGARWWGGLLTKIDEDLVRETGTCTYALSELMVRVPWRKTGPCDRNRYDSGQYSLSISPGQAGSWIAP